MKVLVTGAAGFIGSTLAEKLVLAGHEVTGVDNFDSYYPAALKRLNLASIDGGRRFTFIHGDIAAAHDEVFDGIEVVFHLAGTPGVRPSWGETFGRYVHNNIQATQRLLVCLERAATLKRIVYASSSSVYGEAVRLPFAESDTPRPVSPYGVTKLAAEHLCLAYGRTLGVPVVCLRYFTVYGPRQRPDMAFHRFIRAGMLNEPLRVYGTGEQTRDFTFIDDIVGATMRAGLDGNVTADAVVNIGSGKRIPLTAVIETIRRIAVTECIPIHEAKARGDMCDTCADISLARELLGYRPQVDLGDGIREQYRWMVHNRNTLGL